MHSPIRKRKTPQTSEESFNPSRDEWSGILAKAPFDINLNAHTHQYKYVAKGADGNNFPVVIGGGNNERSATVSILQKKGKQMMLTVLNAEGETLLLLKF